MARVLEEETGLSTRREVSGELSTAAAVAAAQQEIQASIVIARKFPRNEDQCFERLMKACKRTSFAEDAAYSFPRGGAEVTGPSVNVAREAARVWGNIRYGLYVIRDDEESRQIRGWSWDMETNTKVEAEDDFQKLVYRKKQGWVKPDERDLRELTNRRGAILVRNCLLQILPKDLVEDALNACKKTLESKAAQDPDGERKKIILAFSDLNITPEMLEKKLGHLLAESTPKEIADLRKIYASIRDGNSTWHEYIEDGSEKKPTERGKLDLNDVKPGKEENRGHGNENLEQAKSQTPEAPNSGQGDKSSGVGTPSPEASGPCSQSDFDNLEILATELRVSQKGWKKHIQETMGFASWDLLTKNRLPEVQAWIQANKKV